MINLLNSGTLRSQVQLIWMSGSPRDPTIRILLAVSAGNRHVYEGIALWSAYRDWLGHILDSRDTEQELRGLKKMLVKNKYALLSGLNIPSDDLFICGLQRVDE